VSGEDNGLGGVEGRLDKGRWGEVEHAGPGRLE
jgi:hypothetical protein